MRNKKDKSASILDATKNQNLVIGLNRDITVNMEEHNENVEEVVAMTDTIKGNRKEQNTKEVLSARDYSVIRKSEIKLMNKGSLDLQTCMICCDKPADAVLLPCGHGGLCYGCGKKIGAQSGDCYLCRKVLFRANI